MKISTVATNVLLVRLEGLTDVSVLHYEAGAALSVQRLLDSCLQLRLADSNCTLF